MTPTWFTEAHAKLGVDELWLEVEYEMHGAGKHCERPWDLANACMGIFSSAFDKWPGTEQARKNWYEMSWLTDEERQDIVQSLERRGIYYLSKPQSPYCTKPIVYEVVEGELRERPHDLQEQGKTGA